MSFEIIFITRQFFLRPGFVVIHNFFKVAHLGEFSRERKILFFECLLLYVNEGSKLFIQLIKWLMKRKSTKQNL